MVLYVFITLINDIWPSQISKITFPVNVIFALNSVLVRVDLDNTPKVLFLPLC